jgi:hypothetical protein
MAVATLREARGVCGATLGFLKRRLTGREPALVASFFPRRARRRRRGNGMSTNKRGRLRPTHEWDLLVPLFEWPEQKRYEEIRPLVLFDVSVAERAEEVGLSQRARCTGSSAASRPKGWRASSPRRRPGSASYRRPSGASSWTSRPSTRPSTSTRGSRERLRKPRLGPGRQHQPLVCHL